MHQVNEIFIQGVPTIYHWCLDIDGHKISHTHHMSRISKCYPFQIIQCSSQISMEK